MTTQNKIEDVIVEMVRDFSQVGTPAKSEIRRRINALVQQSKEEERERMKTIIQRRIKMWENGVFPDKIDELKYTLSLLSTPTQTLKNK